MPWRPLSQLPARDRAIVRALLLVLLLNTLVALAKIATGLLTARLAILADGFHALLDGANNVVGIVAMVWAARPPDEDHPYGHRKFENVASMLIGGLIVLMGWEILQTAAQRTWDALRGQPLELAPAGAHTLLFAGILLATLVINFLVVLYETRRGRELQSPILSADARHTLADLFVTTLALASLLAGHLAWWIDPLLALGVLAFLLRAAWAVLSENLPALTDHAFLSPLEVDRVARAVPGVASTWGIRSHGTAADIHLDLNIAVAGTLTAAEVEQIERAVRQRLREAFPGLTLVAITHRTHDGPSNA